MAVLTTVLQHSSLSSLVTEFLPGHTAAQIKHDIFQYPLQLVLAIGLYSSQQNVSKAKRLHF